MEMNLVLVGEGLQWGLNAIGVSAILAAAFKRNARFEWLFKIIDTLAFNWANARNAR